MLDFEMIGRVEDIEKKIREEISCQVLNFDLDSEIILHSVSKLISLLCKLCYHNLNTIVKVNLNEDKDTYIIVKLVEESEK